MVRILRPLRENQGPQYNLGDIVTFPDDKAQRFLEKGWVERYQAPVPDPPKPAKDLPGPPVDKQVKRPPVQK